MDMKTRIEEKDGFSSCGSRYLFHNPHRIQSADADLWNDEMRLQIDHRGRVIECGFMQPDMTSYAEPLRCFYVRDDDSGEYWSVPFEPCRKDPDRFVYSIGRCDLKWSITHHGVHVDVRVVVPRDDNVELWTLSVSSAPQKRKRRISVYTYFPVGRRSFLTQRATYDDKLQGMALEFFDYYVAYTDYYRLNNLRNKVVCAADRRPASWELSIADFLGNGTEAGPDQLQRSRLYSPTHEYEIANERSAGILHFPLRLEPGKRETLNFIFGPAKDRREMVRLKRKYLRPGGIDAALDQAERFLDRFAPQVQIETPDRDFNHYINHWQSRRTLSIVRTMRHCMAPQGRNAIQDAMGGVYVDPSTSRAWFMRIWCHQHTNGWLPHGMPFAEGVRQPLINSIPHKDINVWGPEALHFYVAETGDFGILEEEISFADKPREHASLYQHVCLGLEWLLNDRTRRGLCRIGQGDWNDPLNMAGIREAGESIWLSQALALACCTWANVAVAVGDCRRAAYYRREAEKLRTAVNRYGWDGAWYVRGYDDRGIAFGVRARREGKIFLNAQSWAIMSGTADGERTASCIDAVERMLATPAGPMTLAPPFTRMDENIGKLSQKIPGWNENGSVYCHAAAFYAYALFQAGDAERGFSIVRSLLPGGGSNSIERSGQLPLYIPNFYRGEAAGRKAGLSSHSPNSGTAAWYYRTTIAMLMGVRAELNGLIIDPKLPSCWRNARVHRRWREAEFDIEIRSCHKGEKPRLEFNGTLLEGNFISPQRPGSKHHVLAVCARSPR